MKNFFLNFDIFCFFFFVLSLSLGELFEDDARYDSLPSDSNFDGHMIGRFGGGRSYGKSYQSSGAGSSTGFGGLTESVDSEGGGKSFNDVCCCMCC